MIDWHSHILPAMDDGSHDETESLAMLSSMADQGVDTVIATPHFLANHESSISSFLARRAESEMRLRACMDDRTALPRVICGAEVAYFPGISRMDDLPDLTIGQSQLLLLEMPFEVWTEYTVRELSEMLCDGRYTVVLAHMERYWYLQSRDTHERLLAEHLNMQINASYLLRWSTRRKALRLLSNKVVRFIGSDAHNMSTRPPRIGEAYDIVRRKLGGDFLQRFDRYGKRMLEVAN